MFAGTGLPLSEQVSNFRASHFKPFFVRELTLSFHPFPLKAQNLPFIAIVSLLLFTFNASWVLGQEAPKNIKDAPVESKKDEKKNGDAKKSENGKEEKKEEVKEPELTPLQKLQFQLFQVTKRSVLIRQDLVELRKKPSTKENDDRIIELQLELDSLNRNFESLATQLHEEQRPKTKEEEFSWTQELQEITQPILQAIREVTSRPRRIETLKAKIESLKVKIKNYESARKNLKSLQELENGVPDVIEEDKAKDITKKTLSKTFHSNLDTLYDKYNPEILTVELEETLRKLIKIQQADRSVFGIVAEAMAEFFQVRGRNFGIGLATFVGLWWVLNYIFVFLNEKTNLFSVFKRPIRKIIKTAFSIFALGFSIMASLLTLYLLNDWLLLSMVIMILIAIGWTSRNLLPKFFRELRLILNLSTVREGERLFWKGVPWLIKELGVYATLMNPRLEGGTFKLPVGELFGQHSRPFVKGEPWFPCQPGDYVILSDDTFGKVLSQTPEQVILESFGSRKFYMTPEFLTLKPRNLTDGYLLVIVFGLDYGIQSRISKEIPAIFEEGLRNRYQNEMESVPPVIETLKVQFDSAAASSLNIKIFVKVNGKNAGEYYYYNRLTNAYLVDICNEHGLTIPFTQLTLSLDPDLMEEKSLGKQLGLQQP